MTTITITLSDELATALAEQIPIAPTHATIGKRAALQAAHVIGAYTRNVIRQRQIMESMKTLDGVLSALIVTADFSEEPPELITPPEAMMPQTDEDPRAIQDDKPAVQVDV